MVKEMFVSDIHDGMWVNPKGEQPDIEGYYSKLEKIVQAFKPDRLILGGDISEEINQEILHMLQQHMEKDERFQAMSEEEKTKNLYFNEAMIRYMPHAQALESIKKICPNIFGLFGNHDSIAMPQAMKNVQFGILEQQPLLEEKILMGYNCGYNRGPGTEIDPAWAGPGTMFAPPNDDDHMNLDNSKIYQLHKDKDIDLIAIHNSGKHGEVNAKFPTGLGTAELANKNGAIVYCGHIHGHLVCRDPKTNVLIIRTGPRYAALIEREGKEVTGLELIPIEYV